MKRGLLFVLATASWAPALAWAEVPRTVPADPANYTRRSSRAISRIVIHTIEGSEEAGISWFQNPQARVSAHYVVSQAGRVTQMVADHDVAWHAGTTAWNRDSIGIECEGYAARDGWTTRQYAALAELIRGLCDRYGIPVDRAHLVGHSEITTRKADPGVHFDWDRVLALVGSGSPAAVGLARHVVQPGETLGRIAARWETTVAELVDLNRLADPDRLDVGRELRVPRPGREVVEVRAGALNVRDAVWGQVLGQARRGQRFAAGARRDGWRRLEWSDGQGWVSESYLERVTASLRFVARPTRARTGPSAGATPVVALEAGRACVEVGRDGGWVRVQVDDRAAWVRATDLD